MTLIIQVIQDSVNLFFPACSLPLDWSADVCFTHLCMWGICDVALAPYFCLQYFSI